MATAEGDALGATGQVIRRRSDDALTGKGGAADEQPVRLRCKVLRATESFVPRHLRYIRHHRQHDCMRCFKCPVANKSVLFFSERSWRSILADRVHATRYIVRKVLAVT